MFFQEKTYKLITALVIAASFIFSEGAVFAKKPTPALAKPSNNKVSSLGQMKCKNITTSGDFVSTPVNYRPLNRDIPIDNNQLLRAVGFLSITGLDGWGIYPGYPQEIVCNLPQKFKKLNLAFAFNARDIKEKAHEGIVVKFAVYRGGKIGQSSETEPVEYAYLRLGDQVRWEINLQNSGYLKLEVQCLGNPGVNFKCPALYFFQDTLR